MCCTAYYGFWIAADGTVAAHNALGACTKKVGPGNTGALRKVAGTATADASCTSCIPGTTFGPDDGSGDCAAVTACGIQINGASRLYVHATAFSDHICSPCFTGSWAATGAEACAACTLIPNANTVTCTTSSNSVVATCAAGFYGAVGSTACDTCTSQTGCTGDTAYTCSTATTILNKLQCATASAGYYIATSQVVTACTGITNAAIVWCTTSSNSVVISCNAGAFGAVGKGACSLCTGITNAATVTCTTSSNSVVVSCNAGYTSNTANTACVGLGSADATKCSDVNNGLTCPANTAVSAALYFFSYGINNNTRSVFKKPPSLVFFASSLDLESTSIQHPPRMHTTYTSFSIATTILQTPPSTSNIFIKEIPTIRIIRHKF